MLRRVVFTLAIAIGLLSVTAWADSQARIVRLSYLDGDVQIDRGDTQGFAKAFLNMPVIEGARLWTRDDAHAEVEFEDGSTARLTPNTIVNFEQLRLRNDRRVSVLALQEGELYFNLHKHDDDLRVDVGQQELIPGRSTHFRVFADKEHLAFGVFRGEVELVKRNGERVRVRKNESLSLNFTDVDRYYLAREVPQSPQDLWDREREEDANASLRNAYTAYSPAYSYGNADLYRYGAFITYPGYGQVWRPYDVDYGWQPYADGYWVSYPGQGYVWVSPYQWGWTPYRYGSWINIPGQGWCWQPGRDWHQWSAVPVYQNPPNRFVAPTPPSTSGVSVVTVGNAGGIMSPRPERGHRFGQPDSHLVTQGPSSVVVPSSSQTSPQVSSAVTSGRDRHPDLVEVDRSYGKNANVVPVRPIAVEPATKPVQAPTQGLIRPTRGDRASQPVNPSSVVSSRPQPPITPAPAEHPARAYSPPPPTPAMRAPEMRPPFSPPPAMRAPEMRPPSSAPRERGERVPK